MKNKRGFLAVCLAALCLAGAARAEATFQGTVVAGEQVTVSAPIGGTVLESNLRQGGWIETGEAIATLNTTRVFAPADGTVRGIFAAAGDSAEDTVLYLAPVSKYTVAASVSKAYSSAATKYVTIGETVYISCATDGSHRAVGRITGVEGSNYTVEVTGGELYMEETVYIYRKESYASSSRIGSGTVSRTAEIAVSGSGSVLRMYVADGEEVERGQLLFECVAAAEGETAASREIVSTLSGVIASADVQAGQTIAQNATLITVYPLEGFRVELEVEEADLSLIAEGDAVNLYFNWDEDGAYSRTGTVAEISYLGEQTEEGGVVYRAYVDFAVTAEVRLGMTVSASVAGDD